MVVKWDIGNRKMAVEDEMKGFLKLILSRKTTIF